MCVVPRSFEKQGRWKNVDTLQRGSNDGRVPISHDYFRQSAQYIRAVADWCEELSQQVSDHSSSSIGNLVAKVNDKSEFKVAPTVVSVLTKSPVIDIPAQGNLVQQHKERFENFPEDVRVSNATNDAGFIRKVSLGQCFVTFHDIELAGFGSAGSCRENTSLRDDKGSKPKGWIRWNTKIGPVLEVKVTYYLERYGIEVKIEL